MTRDENDRRSARKATSPRRAGPPDRQPGAAAEAPHAPKVERQRIAKLMARVGLCSRRDAESWILGGRVSVNGVLLTSPATDVGPDDQILVDGVPLPASEKTRLFLFHKPAGLITSDHDPEGRETVHDYLRRHWPEGPRVVTIGRLDYNTEGLLLLTNDGGLARVLELPRTGWMRRYRARAKGETNQAVLDGLREGVSVEGVDYAGIEAKLDRIQGANCWLTVGLREGKNREVKRVLEHIGLEVNRLIRLSFGPFQLLDLAEGAVEEVKTRVLREQLGPALAEAAGVDFGDAEATATIVPAPTRAAKPAFKRDRPNRDDRPERQADRRDATRARTPREPRGGEREVTPAPPEKREKPVAGPRRHVSALRAATGAVSRAGERKRVERTDTIDRKNRTVTVERLVPRAPATSRKGMERRPRRSFEETAPPPSDGRGSRSAQGKRERIARSGAVPREERATAPPSRRPTGDERPARSGEREARRERTGPRSDSHRQDTNRQDGRREDRSPRRDADAPRSRTFSGKPSSARTTRPATGRSSAGKGGEARAPRGKGLAGNGHAAAKSPRGAKPGGRAGGKGGAPAAPRRPGGGARPSRGPRR